MNIAQMMKQAQQMQKRLQDAQTELSNTEFSAISGNGAVTVVCDGQGKFKSIKLTNSALNPENPESVDVDTIEMLEDLITTAMSQATSQASTAMQSKMKALTGGINIPGLF
jgi:DNA-binding YbaB/EbfC family protein